MSYQAEAQRLADAIREGANRELERRGPGRRRATVTSVEPLLLDVHGEDLEFDAHDVTLGKSVVAAGFEEGDVLVLMEVDDEEWIAVEVEGSGG